MLEISSIINLNNKTFKIFIKDPTKNLILVKRILSESLADFVQNFGGFYLPHINVLPPNDQNADLSGLNLNIT